MSFHHLSRNKVETATHDLTSLLGLGPNFCPQVDRVSFKYSESMIARLIRDAKTRWFILNNNHSSKDNVSPRLNRRNDIWEPSKACGSIEGSIDRFGQALRKDFFP